MLVVAAHEAGGRAREIGIARDDREALAALVAVGLEADLLLITGGVSAGDFDLVPETLVRAGVTCVFHKIALRPGKPLWFGVYPRPDQPDCLVFGLPGNPVSSFVGFQLFVRPAIRACAGHAFAGLPPVRASLAHDYEHPGGREAYLPCRRDALPGSGEEVTILTWQGSADMATLGRANGLVRLTGGSGRRRAGTAVEVLPI